MKKTKKIVIVAGEESGDLHAAKLIQQLKAQHPSLQISGIGGTHMQQAGAELIVDLARYGVTGLTEVVTHLNTLRKAFNSIATHLHREKPDLLILVDYPGFNLRLAKYAKKKLGIKILYYISPQIWAWKANRIHHIKKYIDHMAVILPFEKKLYQKAGVPVDFVGHPLVEKLSESIDSNTCRQKLHLSSSTPIIAVLPGSRTHEIERHMPILQETIHNIHQQNPECHFIIPLARTIKPEQIHRYFKDNTLPVSVVSEQAITCMAAADLVIVASGTASLECALLEKPMCIIYKSTLLTYVVARQLVKVKFLGLCNLLANKMIVPEFLQEDCNAHELSRYVLELHNDAQKKQHMRAELASLKASLSINQADKSLFDLVNQVLAN